jgi:elongation of very long chain fatty acids protein 6
VKPTNVGRKKKSSALGNILFSSFLAVYAASMGASFQGKIPWQKWEIMNLREHISWAHWMIEFSWIPVVLSVAYIVLTFGTKWYLKNKAGWDKELRMPLAVWSVLLAVFSWAGSLRTVPMMFRIINERGVMHLVCGDTRYEWLTDNPAGFWTLMFCLSKIPELLDTAFIVLRKKELITLHWYHHFTVMLFCWQAWASCTLNGLIFAAMNLTVHTVMYTFYALTALGYRPTTFALFITLGQISQMVVGTAVTAYVTMDKVVWHPIKEVDFSLGTPDWFLQSTPRPDGGECHVSSGNALAGLVMYGSYLLFFVHFFIQAYCLPGGKGE